MGGTSVSSNDSPPTLSLSHSPSSTDSSSGDRTIQMSTFIDTTSPPSQFFLFGISDKTHPQTLDVPLRHILTRPSLRLCLMLIPHPGCCSHLMSRMASTRPSYTTTRPGLMPCIPIGLFDSHVFPFLSVFSLSLSFSPLFLCYIPSVPASPMYGKVILCLYASPLTNSIQYIQCFYGCSVNRVPYIHTYQMSTTSLLLMRSHSVFNGITHDWHLLLAFMLELYLVADVHIYPLNRTS
jgi:hypothetical protein